MMQMTMAEVRCEERTQVEAQLSGEEHRVLGNDRQLRAQLVGADVLRKTPLLSACACFVSVLQSPSWQRDDRF
jgi:hypothetical protein